MSVPIATGSTERKFAEPTIFSAIPNASAETVSVYYMAILSKSKLFYICKHLHFCHVTINDMAQRDPICNMMVDEKKAQHISEANGQKIYLCSAQCKTQFDQNPNKYGY